MKIMRLNVGNALLLSTLLTWGCHTSSENNEQVTSPVHEPSVGSDSINSVESELFSLILGDFKDGLFRGISFGDPKEKIKITETFEVFEETPTYIGFTHDTKQLETIDVYYYTEGDRVNEIVTDIFMNSASSTGVLQKQIIAYYTKTLGAPITESDNKVSWQHATSKIILEDVSSGIDNGLKLTFEKK